MERIRGRKSHIRDAKGIKNKAGRSLTCQPDSFGVDGYLLRPMAPRYTRREFSALERGLLRLLEETGLIGQGGAPDLTELGGVFLRLAVGHREWV